MASNKNPLDSCRIDFAELKKQNDDKNKEDSIIAYNYTGKPISIQRWFGGKLVAHALFCLYADATCPGCHGKKFSTRKNGIPGLVECMNCGRHSVLTTIQKKKAELVNIVSLEKGKGYARNIIEFMKEKNERIMTSWDDSTEEGRALCLSCGLVRYDTKLIWSKMDA